MVQYPPNAPSASNSGNPHCVGCIRDNPDCLFCWRREPLPNEGYAAKMRAGQTPFFKSRRGHKGQWGTGIERREHSLKGWRSRNV